MILELREQTFIVLSWKILIFLSPQMLYTAADNESFRIDFWKPFPGVYHKLIFFPNPVHSISINQISP